MTGYIQWSNDKDNERQGINFGFAVSLPEMQGERVVFDVERISAWSQRNEPVHGALIGQCCTGLDALGRCWEDARLGGEYQRLGIYLGHKRVLLTRLEGTCTS